MSDRNVYRQLNVAQTLTQAFPNGSSTDSVFYSIYDVDDNAQDVASTAMTNESGTIWSAQWTPTEAHTFVIDYFNATLDIHYYEYVKVTGESFTGGGAGLGTTLSNLRTRFLKMIDNYNANDLTGTNSSGEIADLCINDALQLIYSQIKDSKYMQAYSGTLSSVANQAYIELSGISDLDEVASMKDTTNNITLVCIPAHQYFTQVPNPADQTGTPSHYCRIFQRVYLTPRPVSVIAYTTEYVKSYARLSADSDIALIPTKYDDWIYKEARVLWLMMEDISNTQAIAAAKSERDEAREIYINDIMADFDLASVSKSHWTEGEPTSYPYSRPVG